MATANSISEPKCVRLVDYGTHACVQNEESKWFPKYTQNCVMLNYCTKKDVTQTTMYNHPLFKPLHNTKYVYIFISIYFISLYYYIFVSISIIYLYLLYIYIYYIFIFIIYLYLLNI